MADRDVVVEGAVPPGAVKGVQPWQPHEGCSSYLKFQDWDRHP